MSNLYMFFLLTILQYTTSQDENNLVDISVGDVLGEEEVASNVLEVISGKAAPEVIPSYPEPEQRPEFNRNPYINTFQRTQHPTGFNHNGLDIIGFSGQTQTNPNQRPTIDSLNSYAASQGKSVTTPEDLLDMCCQFPACYDPLYELCIDTCRKCETVYPVTSWLPCPPLLNIPDCTSPNLSWMVIVTSNN